MTTKKLTIPSTMEKCRGWWYDYTPGELYASMSSSNEEFDPYPHFIPHSIGGKAKAGAHTTFALFDDGTYYGEKCKGCHAMLSTIKGKNLNAKVKELYVSLWTRERENSDKYEELWELMLDKKSSPWRMVLKDSEILYATDSKGVSRPIAFVLRDMEQPFQVIANLCIVTRMPFAQGAFLPAYLRFREAGFSKINALYLTINLGYNGGKPTFPYAGDYPFDTAWADVNYKQFVEGTPVVLKANKINKGEGYTPCNAIWYTDGKKFPAKQLTNPHDPFTDAYYSWPGPSTLEGAPDNRTLVQRLVSERKIMKVFGQNQVHNLCLPMDEAIKVLKKTRKEWQVL